MSWTTFIGVGGIVVRDRAVLMVRQRRPYGVYWELPSGYYEPAESLEQAAAREVLEEAGVKVDVGELVCTLVWEREQDRRRNVLAFFLASPIDPAQRPRPQTEEDIEDAAFLDPIAGTEIHPLNRPILDRWWESRSSGFHLYADVTVHADGTQTYSFREAPQHAS